MTTEKKVWLISFLFIALFVYGIWSAFRPASFPLVFVRGSVRAVSENVIIGPYPTEKEFRKLKYALGVDELVSLMDPASAIEGGFVTEEKKTAEELGMGFKNFPMDFLHLSSTENKRQVERVIAFILASKDKKLYVHCYLGRHRIAFIEEGLKALEPGKAKDIEPEGGG